MRAAAVADFLRSLMAHGSGDLNAVLTTLNDGDLERQVVRNWTQSGWISVAPSNPLLALCGPRFTRDLTLERFCGREPMPSADLGDGEDEVPEEPNTHANP